MEPAARRRLEEVLDREIEVARSLAETLAAERNALTGDSAETVERRAADKIRILETIEGLEAERLKLCPSPGAAGMAATVAERWSALMELMAGCRTANEVNGQIIHVRQYQVRQLIDIIRGSGPSLTYGPQGKTFAKALRALARA
ncbi:MAG TPA: flagellar protein FlgN [Steroidobacteraceae bacterium]|jgi:flagellar biosynthesis/type III secretory pathway chaperone|nr:flagellar protein FlgN [Steroidobacteraceae bacterium]